jgi:hypothetical protein
VSFLAYLALTFAAAIVVGRFLGVGSDDDDEDDDITCARCGAPLRMQDAVPEEGDEWECHRCNVRWNEIERQDAIAKES